MSAEAWIALALIGLLLELRAYTGVSFWRLWKRLDDHGKRIRDLESERTPRRQS